MSRDDDDIPECEECGHTGEDSAGGLCDPCANRVLENYRQIFGHEYRRRL